MERLNREQINGVMERMVRVETILDDICKRLDDIVVKLDKQAELGVTYCTKDELKAVKDDLHRKIFQARFQYTLMGVLTSGVVGLLIWFIQRELGGK